MKFIRKLLRPIVPKAFVPHAFRGWVWGVTFCESLSLCRREPFLPLPRLRFKVSGNPQKRQYLAVGRQIKDDLQTALKPTGKRLYDFKNILDFGCGCGRTLIWLRNKPDDCRLFGSDTDGELIDWCQKHLDFVECRVNPPLPPTDYPDDKFDLIFLISVFTHLDEEYQRQWLAELNRIAQPSGIVLISVHGPTVARQKLPPDLQRTLAERGALFYADSFWKLYFSEYYQTSFHTPEYIKNTWSQYFDVIDYVEQGINNWHDLVVLKKVC